MKLGCSLKGPKYPSLKSRGFPKGFFATITTDRKIEEVLDLQWVQDHSATKNAVDKCGAIGIPRECFVDGFFDKVAEMRMEQEKAYIEQLHGRSHEENMVAAMMIASPEFSTVDVMNFWKSKGLTLPTWAKVAEGGLGNSFFHCHYQTPYTSIVYKPNPRPFGVIDEENLRRYYAGFDFKDSDFTVLQGAKEVEMVRHEVLNLVQLGCSLTDDLTDVAANLEGSLEDAGFLDGDGYTAGDADYNRVHESALIVSSRIQDEIAEHILEVGSDEYMNVTSHATLFHARRTYRNALRRENEEALVRDH